jgi:hypothetical protein
MRLIVVTKGAVDHAAAVAEEIDADHRLAEVADIG